METSQSKQFRPYTENNPSGAELSRAETEAAKPISLFQSRFGAESRPSPRKIDEWKSLQGTAFLEKPSPFL